MVESLDKQLRGSPLYYSACVLQASNRASVVHYPSAICFFSWPCGELSWRIYRPQEDRDYTCLALSKDIEGCHKLSGSLLLLQTLCPRLCGHCQTPLQANWGAKRISVDQRVWESVFPAKHLADNSSHVDLGTVDGQFIFDKDTSNTDLGAVLF